MLTSLPGIISSSIGVFADWDISGAVYFNTIDLSAQSSANYSGVFNDDGSIFYLNSRFTTDTIFQYTAVTVWDITTLVYANKSYTYTTQDSNGINVQFSADGTKMYITGVNSISVYQYTLTTAWDVSTASYASKFADLSGEQTSPSGVIFGDGGTKMYGIDQITQDVYQYTLTTAWDVSTASYASKLFVTGVEMLGPRGIALSPSGKKLFILDAGDDNVEQYTLSTAWDIGTTSYDVISFYVGGETGGSSNGLSFDSTGTNMYIIPNNGTNIYQYTL